MLLIIAHAPTKNTQKLADSLLAGANDDALDVPVTLRSPSDVSAETLNGADAVLILTPANFGYMSGLTKDMFDRTFLAIGGSLSDDGMASAASGGRKPYGLCVHGRYDTEGAVRSVQSILNALPWNQVAPVLTVMGDVADDEQAQAYELGATLAAHLT